MEKVTLSKAKDEVLDFATVGMGTALGIIAMKFASGYGLNKWLVGSVGLVGGIALRVMGSGMVKSLGTGLGAAGAADLTKKSVDLVATKVPALKMLSDNLPSFSGFPADPFSFNNTNPIGGNGGSNTLLRGMRGPDEYSPVTVVSSTLLR